MTENANTHIRLSKAAKEFNIGKDTIVEFLSERGFHIDSSPNTKLTSEMFELLVKEYGTEENLKPLKPTAPKLVSNTSSSYSSWSDDQIIQFLKDYWGCEDFVFDCKVSDKPYRTEKAREFQRVYHKPHIKWGGSTLSK